MITHPLVMFAPAPWSCELRYNPVDPTAVTLVTPKGTWHMARALLATGMLGPAGCMDVRIRVMDPYAEFSLVKTWVRHRQRVRNETTLLAAASEIQAFLDATYEAVPPEQEVAQLAGEVDGLIFRLSERGAA